MPTLHATIILLLSLLPSSLAAASSSALAGNTKRLVTKLLHRDTVLYNLKDSVEDRAQRTLNTSITRFIYLSQKISQTHDTRAHLRPATTFPFGIFYVSFSIGQPPVQQLAVMDSGSSLTWVKCQPCKRCSGTTYDPSNSLTYNEFPCNSSFCSNDCGLFSNECMYRIKYVKGPDSQGTIATEQFGFETSDEGKIFVNDATFGCSHSNSDFEDEQFSGVFGLGTGIPSLSLVQKFGSKFSYCIGNFNDPEYRYNMLILGEGAIIEGDSTPVNVIDGTYYISLEAISIGEKMLDIDPNIFKKRTRWDEDGVFIDSGTSFTWLAPRAFQTLRRQIENLSDGLLTRHLKSPAWLLCFSGDIREDLWGFPAMTFHFSGGVDLVLDAKTMFYQDSSSVFCLAVGPSDFIGERLKDVSIIGMIAQQNYNVGYDLVENQLYFQRIECELLAD
ncbi:aspartic proteinase CDR1-like [Melia azedarach]|uniref:Aspartic proteinase CDR1-like n=1 Tax=Melia azedarach TaxID=155640 RepID=A0ACC1XDL7_MELAZ|nr:aspartic proteinase CDR1-like [Melia azedarach]